MIIKAQIHSVKELMNLFGVEEKKLESFWFTLSKTEYMFVEVYGMETQDSYGKPMVRYNANDLQKFIDDGWQMVPYGVRKAEYREPIFIHDV